MPPNKARKRKGNSVLIILAVDTTAKTSTVALTEDERLIGLSIFNTENTHSTTLLPTVESILGSACVNVGDIDLFVCSAGPGSFTGVRIGAATVKGLAFTNNTKCIGVSSLEALAMNIICQDGLVCAVMDARRNQLYNALFELKKGGLERKTDDRVITKEELVKELTGYRGKVHIVGDGYDIAAEALKDLDCPKTAETAKYQNAYSVAMLGLKKYRALSENEREKLTPAALAPVYLRVSQAEREREEKLKTKRTQN